MEWCGLLVNLSLLIACLNWTGEEWRSVISLCFSLTQSSKATTDRKLFPKPAGFEGESNMCDPSEKGNLAHDLELGHAQAECLVGGADAEESSSALLSRKTAVTQFEGKALGLDKAILHSIDSCGKYWLYQHMGDSHKNLGANLTP